MKSPYLSIAEAAMQQMIRLSVEFGLTPSSRSRIRVPPGARKSKLDQFLDKKQRA
jgi:phage terminase small subunit